MIVNDGSHDGSAQLLEELSDAHPRLRVIHLIRNFGQQAAMLAGIGEAKGRILITMDTDLQHPAMVIPEMIRKWEQGPDVVYGIPINQVTSDEDPIGLRPPYRLSSLSKKFGSTIYRKLISLLQERGQTYVSTDFRLMDREVAEVIKQLPEKNLYLRNVFAWLCPLTSDIENRSTGKYHYGFSADSILYVKGHRHQGMTKYSTTHLVRLGIMGLTHGSVRPLRMAVIVGGIAILISGLTILAQVVYHGVTWAAWRGWEILLMAGLLIGSVQLIILCLIGWYAGKIYLQSQGRPHYISRNNTRKVNRQKWRKKMGQVPLPLPKE